MKIVLLVCLMSSFFVSIVLYNTNISTVFASTDS